MIMQESFPCGEHFLICVHVQDLNLLHSICQWQISVLNAFGSAHLAVVVDSQKEQETASS